MRMIECKTDDALTEVRIRLTDDDIVVAIGMLEDQLKLINENICSADEYVVPPDYDFKLNIGLAFDDYFTNPMRRGERLLSGYYERAEKLLKDDE